MLIKAKEDIKTLEKSGKIIGEVLSKLGKMCKAGVSTFDVDAAAEKMILDAGGRPAFKGYCAGSTDTPFPGTICASLNHEIVHGIPRPEIVLKNGDIFTIDIGMEWPHGKKTRGKQKRGVYTDTAITVAIGDINEKVTKLMRVTQEALEIAIQAVVPGHTIASIGKAVEDYVKSQGKYGIVRDLVGHGVGYAVHEEPRIPNYYDQRLETWLIQPGMVLALEPMITLGDHRITSGADGWTIETLDRSLCAHYEHTVAVTNKGCKVITRRPEELV